MIRFSSHLQRSLHSIQQIRCATNANPAKKEVLIRKFDDLPSARKFLGIIDLKLLRWPVSKFHEFYIKSRNQLGDIFIFQPVFFMPKMVIVSTPDLISELCAKEGRFPSRGIISPDYPIAKKRCGLPEGLLFAEGTEWKRLRDPLSKRILRPKFISSYFPKLSEIARRTITDIIEIERNQNSFAPVIERLCLWTVNSGDYFSFHRMGEANISGELKQYFDAIMTISQSFGEVKGRSLIEMITNKKRKKLVEACSTVVQYTRKQIELTSPKTTDSDRDHITMLEYLQNETNFDEMEIIDTFVSLLGAGVDTTVKSTQWLWYNLAKYPNVQDKLYEELHSVIGNSPVITAEHYNKLHYMKMCMKESMRVTPTVSASARVLAEDAVMNGFLIPKGTQVILNLNGMYHDERFWDNPLEFKPERWENRKDIDPFSYIPFGIGPRMCVGRRIAEAEMVLITAHLCMTHKIHLEQEPDIKFEAFMRPDGLNLSFHKRD